MRRLVSVLSVCRSFAAVATACLALALTAGGCSNSKDEKAAQGQDEHDHHHHGDHPTAGPKGGAILEWGDHEYHLELLFDRAKQQATIYVLDHDMKKTEATEVETPQLKLDGVDELIPFVPAPLAGETAEKSSCYVATHAALAGKGPFSGRVTGKVKGKPNPYFASFNESAAKDDHDHEGEGDHPHDEAHDKDAHDKEGEGDHKDPDHKDHEHEDGKTKQ